jgi:hypothetical protein
LLEILPSIIGKQLDITSTRLTGSSFDFQYSQKGDDGQEVVSQGKSGKIDLTKVQLSIIGLGSEAEFDIDLRTENGIINGITFGPVNLITKGPLPAPGAKPSKTPTGGP